MGEPPREWDGAKVHISCIGTENISNKLDGARRIIDGVLKILGEGPWGPTVENALLVFGEMPQSELIIGVLRKVNEIDIAIKYFRWLETRTGQPHPPEAYNALLMVMARSRKFDHYFELILEEMSLAGFGPSNSTSLELIASCVKSRRLREAFDIMQMMRKFKFRPAFSAYTTLIGALSNVPLCDLMLTLVHQMQELGYEVGVHLFTTVIRAFARVGRVDAALSLLDEMKSNCFEGDIVLYNVCIDCFGKAGK